MKGILGRKLGMTQIFDPETGGVTAVTVIEAGPCPVVHVRSEAADGYTAVQLAYEPVADRKITKGELGHLKKAGATAHRHLAEFRGDTELAIGDTVTVEAFEPGDEIKVAGTSIGKGFAGTIKRHNFKRGPVSHGSHNIRKPGSIGASATPVPRIQGPEDVGADGRGARHAARARRPPGGRRAQPAAREGLRSGSKSGIVEIRSTS